MKCFGAFVVCAILTAPVGTNAQAPSFSPAQSSRRPGLPSVTDSQATLYGILQLPDGQPAAGVNIEIYNSADRLLASTNTGPDGSFSFVNEKTRRYIIRGEINGQRFSVTATPGLSSELIVRIPSVGVATQAQPAESDAVALQDLQAPSGARKKYEKAMQAMHENNGAQALKLANEVITSAPAWGRGYFVRGLLMKNSQQYAPAEQDLGTAVRLQPTSEALAALGGLYVQTKEFPKAQLYLERAVATNPVAVQAYFELARLRFFQGRYEETIAVAQHVVDADAHQGAMAHVIIAESELALNRIPEAQKEFNLFLAAYPTGPAADKARAQLAKLAGMSGGANQSNQTSAGSGAPAAGPSQPSKR